jgi:hypothetical protein
MTLSQFLNASDNEVIEYAVYRDSLVYLFRFNGKLRAGILNTLNRYLNPLSDPLYVDLNSGDLPVKATKNDFAHYRVCSKGYNLA